MIHDNASRPPLDVEHMLNQVRGIQQVLHDERRKPETDPTEKPKDLYDNDVCT